jgi:uncharacterized integral membrane protein (TIGR00697 family)
MNQKQLQVVAVIVGCYIAAQIFSDITSLKIILLGGLVVDGGTLIYPFSFTLRDLLHKSAGVKVTRTVIVLAAALNLLMAGLFWGVASLPVAPDLPPADPSHAFASVLAPVLQIVLASILAEVLAEFLDTEAYQWWQKRFGARHQWGRVLVSNALSVPLDSAVFVGLAFWGLPIDVLWGIFLTNVLVKGAVTLISIPAIYWVEETSAQEG